MTKVAINLSQFNKRLTIPVIFSKKLSFTQNLLVLIDYLVTISIGLMLILLPVTMYLNLDVNADTSTFIYFILLSIFILTLNLIQIVLAGSSRIVDPKGIFQVLIFALLITVTAVLVSPTEQYQTTYTANTFGSIGGVGIKSLSGLAIIGYVSLIYFVNLFVRKPKHIGVFLDLISFGFILHTLILLINPGFDISQFALLISSIWILYRLFASAAKSFSLKLLYLATIIIDAYLFIDRTVEIDSSLVFVISFSLFIATLPLLIYHLGNVKKFYNGYFQKFINSINQLIVSITNKKGSKLKSINRFIKYLTINLLLIAPYIFLLTSLLIVLFENDLFIVNKFFDDFNYVFEIIKQDIAMLVVGLGSGHATVTTSYFNNIFLSHGLLGLGAYLFIWTFPIYTSYKFLKKSGSKKINDLVIFLLIIEILIPIIGLFIYPGMFIVLLWWLVTGILFIATTKELLNDNSELNTEFYTVNFVGKRFLNNILLRKITTYVIIIMMSVISILIINGFIQNIGNFI